MKNTTKDLKDFAFIMLQELTDPEDSSPEKMRDTVQKAIVVSNLINSVNNTIKQEVAAMKLMLQETGEKPDVKGFLGQNKADEK